MSNPNIAMLENIISAAVSTQYKEVPPTEEERNIYPSMYFHEKMGYHMIGCIEKSGYKFNRWYDTVLMDKMIGEPKEHMADVKSFDEVRAEFNL